MVYTISQERCNTRKMYSKNTAILDGRTITQDRKTYIYIWVIQQSKKWYT